MVVKFKKKILVTSALPYVNNVPHLGTMVCIISADVYTRFLRLKKADVISVLGTDEHGTTTESIAMSMGLTPQQAVDHFFKIHKEVYEWFNCSFDCFGRTSSKENIEVTQDIFLKLHKGGFILEKEEEQMFDEKVSKFLSDRFIEGTCPYCKYEDARGDQCDKCGKLLNPTELIKPRSKLSGTTPVLKSTKHLYIKLNELQPEIEKLLEEKKETWSENAITTTKAWLNEGLRERAITRDLEWGIKVPLKGYENKVFYVWFDAPIGYIAITKEFRKDWKEWWHNSKDVRLVQFMGKDNIPFHSVLFPASLIGADDNYTIIDTLNANEYLNYEDTKFSKSRGIGVFGDDAKETGIDADSWRYYLMINRPEKTDTKFTWKDLQEKVNNELAGNLGNLVNRTLTFINKFSDGQIKEITEHFDYDEDIEKILEAYEKIELKKALKQIMSLSKKANQYFQEQKPWEIIKSDVKKAENALAVLANMIKDLAILVQPIMPSISDNIFEQLNLERLYSLDLLKNKISNHSIGTPKVLFKKLEDEQISELQEKFSGKQIKLPKEDKEPENDKSKLTQTKEALSKFDLRVAEIISVEKHPQADKLFIEKISLGDEQRTIVSGLVGHYSAEELVGKKIVVVYNLKPAELRGVLSQGMLLAAGQGKKVGLVLCPDAKPGTKLMFKDVQMNPEKEVSIDEFFSVELRAEKGKVFAESIELIGAKTTIDKDLEGKVK